MIEREVLPYKNRLSGHIEQYISAVIDNPKVRYDEFSKLSAVADLVFPKNILEFSAEGRMLEYFYSHALIHRADLLDMTKTSQSAVIGTTWDMMNLKSLQYDAVLSIVPIHHATDTEKMSYLKGAFRVLRPGGVLAFAEVEEGSPVHAFLDGFVNQYSRAGHIGAYLKASFTQQMCSAGFEDVTTVLKPVVWHFLNEEDMCAFMIKLFALDSPPQNTLLHVLQTQLGLSQDIHGIHLNWPLRYFRGVVPC